MFFKDIQKKVSNLYADPKASVGDYIFLAKSMRQSKEATPSFVRKQRVAFLSSFTVLGLADVFKTRGIFHNLWIDTYLAPYNQFSQEILNNRSRLYSFDPNIIYLIVDIKDILDEKHLNKLLETLNANSKAKIVLFNFVASPGNYRNRLSPKAITLLNKKIELLPKKYEKVTVFDFANFLKKIGEKKYWYTKYTKLGDLRLAPDAFLPLSEDLLSYAVSFSGNTKKCLVVDLDNTLWRGVVGENGLKDIYPDKKLQKHILKLYKQGIFIAINSKNNIEDAFEAIENHPEMILKKEHFAAWRINWQDKAKNIQELASELNIGLDSLVFLDDSPFEQDLIRNYFSEVAVVPIPYIKNFAGFSKSEITKEDIARNEMYKKERKRKELMSEYGNLDDFLKNLGLKIVIKEANNKSIPRISQLTQKTNQFNLTTRRYQEKDINNFLKNGAKIRTLEVFDKFGEYGITGVIIAKNVVNNAEIDTFLLSCRILGKRIEEQFLGHVLDELKKLGVSNVTGEYIPTPKNSQVKDFYGKVGFQKIGSSGDKTIWTMSLAKYKFNRINFIKVN